MSLRVKLAIAMVLLAVGATVAVGAVSYVSTQHELRQQIDRSLTMPRDVSAAASRAPTGRARGPGGQGDIPRNFTQILVQVIDRDGDVLTGRRRAEPCPVTDADIEVADRRHGRSVRHDIALDGEQFRDAHRRQTAPVRCSSRARWRRPSACSTHPAPHVRDRRR